MYLYDLMFTAVKTMAMETWFYFIQKYKQICHIVMQDIEVARIFHEQFCNFNMKIIVTGDIPFYYISYRLCSHKMVMTS